MPNPTLALQTPVTLLTGWLGAGKTTLLNHLLSTDHGTRYAILVNEFGEIGIDQRLIVRSEDNLVELANGCVCCTIRGDLVQSLKRLREKPWPWSKPPQWDRVVIETTGIAEPAPLLRTFLVEDDIATYYRVQSVLTLVDAANANAAMQHNSAREQIALADVLVINKIDLASTTALSTLQNALREINPTASLLPTEQAKLPLHTIVEAHSRELPSLPSQSIPAQHGDIQSYCLSSAQPLDELKTKLWLDTCVQQMGENLIRYKGFLYIAGLPYRCVLQGVYDLYSVEAHGHWPATLPPKSELVFIGHNLDRQILQRGFQAALTDADL